MGTFGARARELEEMVGDNDLTGHFVVNGGERTVPLHEGFWQNYMGTEGYKKIRNYRDGGPRFVEDPLKERHPMHLQNLADGVLDGTVRERMAENMEDMDDQLSVRAPIEYGALRQSGNRTVVDDGNVFSHVSQTAAPYTGDERR